MANYAFIATGQCGNQLSYELIDQLYQHLQPNSYHYPSQQSNKTSIKTPRKQHSSSSSSASSSTQRKTEITEPSEAQRVLYNSIFRERPHQERSLVRAVLLDTEPKVIDDCLTKRQQHRLTNLENPHNFNEEFPPWSYDTKSCAYQYGGAGNNWSLGYALATGNFLDQILSVIRRQLEAMDGMNSLIFCHSLAGGTGSGLGTRITEATIDTFPDVFTTNVVIAPYHFGEVVVQHYNALLCLSKLYETSQSLVLLENEMAQNLCHQMRGIQRPLLQDLNQVLGNHLVPLFIPKISAHTKFRTHYHSWIDDMIQLTCHPSYRFLNVKLTPQTSKHSIDFTYDHWPNLLKTIQRMQLSGAYSERTILQHVKRLGSYASMMTNNNNNHQQQQQQQQQQISRLSSIQEDDMNIVDTLITNTTASRPIVDDIHYTVSSSSSSSSTTLSTTIATTLPQPPHHHRSSRSSRDNSNISYNNSNSNNNNIYDNQHGINRSLASILTCHGESAAEYMNLIAEDLQQKLDLPTTSSSSSRSHQLSQSTTSPLKQSNHHHHHHHAMTSPPSVTSHRSTNSTTTNPQEMHIFEEYLQSHSSLYPLANQSILDYNHSSFYLHHYQRSAHVIANDQSILPILRRAFGKSEQMFRTGAYVHQYEMYGLEKEDFIQAFYSIGSVINNYEQL
jgi:hypothetical protein